jgi:hypothetical protein
MRQRCAGAVQPLAASAACITTQVFGGKLPIAFQLCAALYCRRVISVISEMPSALQISAAVSNRRVFICQKYQKLLESQVPNLIDGIFTMPGPSSLAMAKSTPSPEDHARAQRLKSLREISNFPNQTAFAKYLEIPLARWNNFERGHPLSLEIAQKLVRLIPGLSLDWLYNGERRGLSVELDRRLHESQPTRGRRIS